MSLIDYSQTKRPVFEIDLDLAPYDRWQEVGRRERARLGRFLGDISERSVKEGDATEQMLWYK